LAKVVYHVLNRAIDGTECHHNGFRPLRPIGAQQAACAVTKAAFKFLRQHWNALQGAELFVMSEVTNLHERFRTYHGAYRDRVRRIEHLPWFESWEESIDIGLGDDVELFVGVSQDKTVHTDHYGAREFFGNAEGQDVEVGGFLGGFGEELNPAGIAHRHGIGVIIPDVDGCSNGAVADSHHNGKAETGGVIDGFGHEQKPLAGSSRIGAGAGSGCANGDGECGKFRLHVDEFAVAELAGLDHLRETFDDVRLRSDGIGADDFGLAEGDGFRDGAGGFNLLAHGPGFLSS